MVSSKKNKCLVIHQKNAIKNHFSILGTLKQKVQLMVVIAWNAKWVACR